MTNIYLHIGTHKTGTTTLQWFLAKNADKLLNHGYLYPTAGQPPHMPGHHQLVWKLKQDFGQLSRSPDNQNLENVWQNLHQEIQQHQPKAVIISSEGFHEFTAQEIEILKQKLSPHFTRNILYLRQQEDYLRSLYCQWVRRSRKLYCQGKESAWETLMAKGDYLAVLSRWEQAFGKENIIVKGFEKSCHNPGLESSLFKAIELDIDIKQLSWMKPKNKSLNIKVIKVMRWCNYFARLLDTLSVPTETVYSIYTKILSNPNYWPTKLILNSPDHLISNELFTPEEKQLIREKFVDINKKISDYYLPIEERPLFPEEVT